MKKLPVFFHIPKNAGTYTYNISFGTLFDRDRPWSLEVFKENRLSYRIICKLKNKSQESKYVRMNGANWRRVSIDNLDLNDLDVLFLEVCDVSFNSYKEDIYKHLPAETKPCEFIILRETYSRIQSIYSYIQSTTSQHEPSHGSFNGMSFEDYLNSPFLEGGWVIRSLVGIENNIPINDNHFQQTCNILDKMFVFDVSCVDEGLKKIFEFCYNIETAKLAEDHYKNKTIDKINVPFDSLDKNTRTAFLNQVRWDDALYDRYIKKL